MPEEEIVLIRGEDYTPYLDDYWIPPRKGEDDEAYPSA